MALHVGDSVGGIYKTSKNGKESWELVEDKINKITKIKSPCRRYFTKSKFHPLDADEVDNNTKILEESIEQGYILTGEIFGLNENTRPYVEKWIAWANEHMDKAVGLLDSIDEEIDNPERE